eukprot:SAG31_NODE_7663_length_1624_cov_0.923279_2_plen_157_part_00
MHELATDYLVSADDVADANTGDVEGVDMSVVVPVVPADATVFVHLVGCSDLLVHQKAASTADAYVILRFGQEELRTATVPKTLAPDFGQLFAFPAHCNPADRSRGQLDETLRLEVWNRNRLRGDSFIGSVLLDLPALAADPLTRPVSVPNLAMRSS